MARLAAVEIGLYYPTPLRVMDLIAQTVEIHSGHLNPKILDVCAGKGEAASTLAKHWGMKAYGVELAHDRAHDANLNMEKCLQGSYHQLQATEGAFDVLFLNPPYDYGENDGVSTRQEVQFLADSLKWLRLGGLLVFIPPKSLLTNKSFQDLFQRHFSRSLGFTFPHPEVQAFNQVVIFAVRTNSVYYYQADISNLKFEAMEVLGESKTSARYLWEAPYREVYLDDFHLEGINPLDIAPVWDVEGCTLGYNSRQLDILMGYRGGNNFTPLMVPRPGHQAMLLASGALDGCALKGNQILKGSSEKTKVTFTESVGDKTEEVCRERIASRLSTLDMETGEYDTWRVDDEPERTADWFKSHGDTLAEAIQSSFQPVFKGDMTPFEEALSKLKAPGVLPGRSKPEFLQQQIEAAGATVLWWKHKKTAILSGEMGVGKTSIAIVASQLANFPRTVIMCPSHLVPKWIRECEKVTGIPGIAVTAKTLSEVDTFFKGPSPVEDEFDWLGILLSEAKTTPRFLVLSKETAKLGARWEPAYKTKTISVSREERVLEEKTCGFGIYARTYTEWVWQTVTSKVETLACHACSEPIYKDGKAITLSDLSSKHYQCLKCHALLWQYTALSAKGTKRWPLARYINKRYKRNYALVLDEMHQFAGANSDQSRAAQDLCSGATKILAMTGTLYGGRASSIFHLLYKVEPSFREMYAYDECDRFVAHHGLFEERKEEEEKTSVYGYRRGGKKTSGRIKEIPGMSPAMIPVILPYTMFLKLKDLRLELPPYTEEVSVVEHVPEIRNTCNNLMSDVKTVLRKHPRILGQYLQACLGYPDCPEQSESIVDHTPEGDVLVASAPAFPQSVLPKDLKVIQIALEEKTKGRKVLVFFNQTHRRNATRRVKAALEAAGLIVKILDSSIAPDKREDWLLKVQKEGFDVMLTNGKLVETGMDLLFATTIIQYSIEYSIPTLRQSIRRSWRLGQNLPIKVVFLAYQGTMQEIALNLIARKMRAAEMVDGDENGGLAQYDESGTNFFVELAQEIVQSALDKAH